MKTEMTTMVMVYDRKSDRVLVIDRLKKYKGISFPGGHVEPGESVYDCAVREVREETGLEISGLLPRGIVDWAKKTEDTRYVEFLFVTEDFSGDLLPGTDEGKIFWLDVPELRTRPLSPNFDMYLPMFFGRGHAEAFGEWTENGDFVALEYKG